jgi:hypothetical protein
MRCVHKQASCVAHIGRAAQGKLSFSKPRANQESTFILPVFKAHLFLHRSAILRLPNSCPQFTPCKTSGRQRRSSALVRIYSITYLIERFCAGTCNQRCKGIALYVGSGVPEILVAFIGSDEDLSRSTSGRAFNRDKARTIFKTPVFNLAVLGKNRSWCQPECDN